MRVIAVTAYLATIVVANWLTAEYGFVPVGLGLLATAGTYAAGPGELPPPRPLRRALLRHRRRHLPGARAGHQPAQVAGLVAGVRRSTAFVGGASWTLTISRGFSQNVIRTA